MELTTRTIPERLMPDEKKQFLQHIPKTHIDQWLAYDSWGIELACKLITLGYPVDLEGMIDEAKSWAPGCEGIDRLHSMLMVCDRALSIAKSSVNAGTIQEHDTPANWLAWAQRKGYDVAHLETEATAPSPQPVVTEGASGGVEPAKAGPGWSLKTSLKRAPGYRWPLYQILKAAHTAGAPCPKARDVLDAWAKKPPLDVQVMSDGVKYNDNLGNPKEANLKAIQQAIKGLLQQ